MYVNEDLQAIYKINNEANEFLLYNLSTNQEALSYLSKRKINQKLIEYFKVGYNPSNNALSQYLIAKKYGESQLINAGLAQVHYDHLNDIFANRITIPIHDSFGNLVGYTARTLSNDVQPKYLNTSTTKAYTKSNIIFNYHNVVKSKSDRIFLVEGASDVIGMAKGELFNSVATLGTAITNEQIALLVKLKKEIVVFYDGDKAGQNATYKFGELASKAGLNFSIVSNRYELDPDEIYMKYGSDTLKKIAYTNLSWIEFLFEYLKSLYNLDNYGDLKKYANRLHQEISTLNDIVEQRRYHRKLFAITGFDFDSKVNSKLQPVKTFKVDFEVDGLVKAQMEIISQMFLSQETCRIYSQDLGYLPDPNYHQLAMYIMEYYRLNPVIEVANFLDFIKDENLKSIAIKVEMWPLANPTFDEKLVGECINRIKLALIDKKILQLNTMVMQKPEKLSLWEQLKQLKKERVELINGKNG